jgi:hypothetical protein
MKILDPSAGRRAIWMNKNHPLAIYLDKRSEVNPTVVCDTREGIPGSGYNLIVWDPPHMNCGPNSNMSKVYGYHTTTEILDTIAKTGAHAHTASAPDALMALKWNDHDIRLERVLELLPEWEALFGHLTKDGPGSQTYWVMLRRLDKDKQHSPDTTALERESKHD